MNKIVYIDDFFVEYLVNDENKIVYINDVQNIPDIYVYIHIYYLG